MILLTKSPDPLQILHVSKNEDPFIRKFPTLHFALIDIDGAVYDFSTMEMISKSKGFLINLPKSPNYLGYSDDKGALFLIDGQLKKPIVKYHEALNNRKYINLPIPLEYSKGNGGEEYFTNALSIGSHFALMFLFSPPAKQLVYIECKNQTMRLVLCFVML